MPRSDDIAGAAALSICESLLLALNDGGILKEHEIIALLQDAAATHEAATDGDREVHAAAAALINGIINGGNSVRRR
ncbi:hypothetical protein [uncultured Albimonas sp.]|uniref:hypothetical protein n=1 Tax=uncultured Albimonas sp. TaxID=1331701 RepID=UPI0030EB8028|tara:strand:+ start:798 stop:1028 length:231 start_codon:yes stop_codon:yes gene_type:complete